MTEAEFHAKAEDEISVTLKRKEWAIVAGAAATALEDDHFESVARAGLAALMVISEAADIIAFAAEAEPFRKPKGRNHD